MEIREITDDDVEAVRNLLVEGFPLRSERYWTVGLANLRALPPVEGYPHYGYVLEADGDLQGLLLTITSTHGDQGRRTNFSSWYVREPYRQFATFLFRHALKLKDTTFINASPSDHVLPIIQAFGFKPYTSGMAILDPRAAIREPSSRGSVEPLRADELGRLTGLEEEIAEHHLRMGCEVLRLDTDEQSGLLIHRRKWIRRSLPSAQVIVCDPVLVAQLAKPVMRALARRGSLLALYDVDQASGETLGRTYARGIRYFKGATAPSVGDLSYSELAVFGP